MGGFEGSRLAGRRHRPGAGAARAVVRACPSADATPLRRKRPASSADRSPRAALAFQCVTQRAARSGGRANPGRQPPDKTPNNHQNHDQRETIQGVSFRRTPWRNRSTEVSGAIACPPPWAETVRPLLGDDSVRSTISPASPAKVSKFAIGTLQGPIEQWRHAFAIGNCTRPAGRSRNAQTSLTGSFRFGVGGRLGGARGLGACARETRGASPNGRRATRCSRRPPRG